MIQRMKNSTDETVAQTLKQERMDRDAKTRRLRELRLERDRQAATESADDAATSEKKKTRSAEHSPKRKKPASK
jgi:hypothetical protein